MGSGSAIPRLFGFLLFGLLAGGRAEAQEWIRNLKNYPPAFLGREVTVEGTVAGAREATGGPGGSYFLVDQSDPTGILVHTDLSVPSEGARVEVRGMLRMGAPGAVAGAEGFDLQLMEAGRTAVGVSVFLTLGAVLLVLATLVLLGFLIQAYRRQRRHELQEPLWLMPLDPALPAPSSPIGPDSSERRVTPTPKFDLTLEASDRQVAAQLRRRTRSLLVATGFALVASTASASWVLVARLESGPRTFAWDPGVPVRNPVTPQATPDPVPEDSLAGVELGGPLSPPPPSAISPTPERRTPPPAPPPPPPTAPPQRVASETTTSATVVQPNPAADTAKVDSTPPIVTRGIEPVPTRTPPPPPPLPPPPPAPTPRPPDSAAIRAGAREAVDVGVGRLVRAISVADQAGLRTMLGGAGNAPRFIKFVKDYKPTATLDGVGPLAITDSGADGVITVAFRWRGDFGAEQSRKARFRAHARPGADGAGGGAWQLDRMVLAERFP